MKILPNCAAAARFSSTQIKPVQNRQQFSGIYTPAIQEFVLGAPVALLMLTGFLGFIFKKTSEPSNP